MRLTSEEESAGGGDFCALVDGGGLAPEHSRRARPRRGGPRRPLREALDARDEVRDGGDRLAEGVDEDASHGEGPSWQHGPRGRLDDERGGDCGDAGAPAEGVVLVEHAARARGLLRGQKEKGGRAYFINVRITGFCRSDVNPWGQLRCGDGVLRMLWRCRQRRTGRLPERSCN